MNWYSWLSKTSLEPSLVYGYGLTFVCNELSKEDVVYFNHEFLQSMGISIAKHRLEILKLARKEIRERPHAFSKVFLAMNKTKRCLSKCIRRLVFHEEDSAALPAGNPMSSPYQVEWRETSSSNHHHKSSKEHNKEEILMLTGRNEEVVEKPSLDGKVQERLMFTKRSPKVKEKFVDGKVKEKFVVPKKRQKNLSGPLDRRVQEKYMASRVGPKVVSGPLDSRLMFTCGSPNVSEPLDGNGRRQEKFMFSNKSPRVLSGPLEGSMKERLRMFTNRSPRVSGPLDGKASPSIYGVYNKENIDGDDGVQSIWATLFQDMKPT